MISSRDKSNLLNNAKKSAYRRFISEEKLILEGKPLPFKHLTFDQKALAEEKFLVESLNKKLQSCSGDTAIYLEQEIVKYSTAKKQPSPVNSAEAEKAAEARRIAEAKKAAEARRIAEAKKAAEAARIAEAEKIAIAKKIAIAEKIAIADRIAKAEKTADDERVVKSEKVADVFKFRSQAAQPPKASGTDSKPLHTASAYVYTIFLYILNSLKIVSRATQKFLSRLIYSFHETAKKSKYPAAGIYAVGLLAFPLSVAMLIATYSRLKLMGFEFPLATVLGLEGVLYLCAFIPALLLKKIEKGFWHIIIILPLTLYTIAIFLEPSRNFIKEIKPYINTYDIVTHQKQNNRKRTP